MGSEITESVSILVLFIGQKAIILVAYVPPRYDKQFVIEILNKKLEHVAQSKIPIIVTRDFNIDKI